MTPPPRIVVSSLIAALIVVSGCKKSKSEADCNTVCDTLKTCHYLPSPFGNEGDCQERCQRSKGPAEALGSTGAGASSGSHTKGSSGVAGRSGAKGAPGSGAQGGSVETDAAATAGGLGAGTGGTGGAGARSSGEVDAGTNSDALDRVFICSRKYATAIAAKAKPAAARARVPDAGALGEPCAVFAGCLEEQFFQQRDLLGTGDLVLTIDASAARDDAGSFVELCTRHDGSQPLLQVEIQHPYGPPDRQPDPPVPCTDFLKESYSFHSLPAGPVAASVVQHGVTAPANEFRTVQSGDDAGVTNGLSDAEPQCLARKFVQIQAGQSVPAELPLTKKNLAGQACDR